MKNGEFLTAPAGAVTSILAITVPNLDEMESVILLVSAVYCTLRSLWITAIKPAWAKIKEAWKAYKERKGGGKNDPME